MINIICVKINETNYGIDIKYIQEIIQLNTVDTFYGLSDFVLGGINIRGEIVAVIDFLQLSIGKETKKLKYLVVLKDEEEALNFGIVVEELLDRVIINEIDLLELPKDLRNETGDFVIDLFRDKKTLVQRINTDKLIELKGGYNEKN